MTVSSGLAKGAVEAASREVFSIISRWAYASGPEKRSTQAVAINASKAAILAFLRHLKDKGPSEQAVLAGARSIGQTMGKPNHNDRSRHCFAAVLGEVISELEQSA
jgi:hypothetical protein